MPRKRGKRLSQIIFSTVGFLTLLFTACGGDGNGGGGGKVPSAWEQVSVAAGLNHTCAIAQGKSLWCWGSAAFGKLGIGPGDESRTTPCQVGTDTDWLSVSAAGDKTYALKNDGGVWFWGKDVPEKLAGTNSDIPVHIFAGTTFAQIEAGEAHNCGLKSDGSLWCWGLNLYGQIGDNTDTAKVLPTQVNPGTSWSAFAVGADFTCGVQTDGSLRCWGNNQFGQLGDGSNDNRWVPTQLGGFGSYDQWVSVFAGFHQACGIRTDGGLSCWGFNEGGELGDGTTADKNVPTAIAEPVTIAGVTWKIVSGWYNQTYGIKSNGSLFCWGWCETSQSWEKTLSGVGTDAWAAIDARAKHVCGIKTDGSLWCWGENSAGQVGDGTSQNTRSAPVLVGG